MSVSEYIIKISGGLYEYFIPERYSRKRYTIVNTGILGLSYNPVGMQASGYLRGGGVEISSTMTIETNMI